MTVFEEYSAAVRAAIDDLVADGVLPSGLDTARIGVEPPREASHGDLATNAALVLAKPAGIKPRDLAERLAAALMTREAVEAADVAGPGFVNLRLADAYWQAQLAAILRTGDSYGRSTVGEGEQVNVEYVSVNPTGPLHVGHCRGAVVGDVLCSLLETVGYDVVREYYVNDAGAQVDALAYSAFFRYLEALGEDADEASFKARFPDRDWDYRGAYLKPVGQALADRHGTALRDRAEADWLPDVRSFAVDQMMRLIKDDLATLGIHHDVFTSEHELVRRGGVDEVLKVLEDRDLLYTGVLEPPKGRKPEDWEPRPQLLFRATSFGDDVDRPMRKSDGSWTYFAPDIANHLDKYRRGSRQLINVWGADHGGYVKRMQAAVRAITDGDGSVDIKLCQMVKLLRGGEAVKMSKRADTFVTLREVVEEVGKDVVRFIVLTRKNDAPLDFDLVKVTEQSRDNPVFYVQYAHARICSVMRHAAALFPGQGLTAADLSETDLARLTDSDEIALIKLMAGWPRLLQGAAEAHEPHRLAFFMADLAAAFHALWNKGKDHTELRFLQENDPALSAARLALIRAVALVIASGLRIFGVEPVEEMRDDG